MNSKKCLLILDMNCMLGYRQYKNVFKSEIKNIEGVKPHLESDNFVTIYRPNFELFMHTLFSKKSDFIDVAVWSNQNKDETDIQLNEYFRNMKHQLKFVLFSKNSNNLDYYSLFFNKKEASQLIPYAIDRNLDIVFNKHTKYNKQNTLLISNFPNLNKKFQENDIVIPLYHPKNERISLTRDNYLFYVQEYLHFLISSVNTNACKLKYKNSFWIFRDS